MITSCFTWFLFNFNHSVKNHEGLLPYDIASLPEIKQAIEQAAVIQNDNV